MRRLWALVVYLVCVFVGGAPLAPWLYWLVAGFAQLLSSLSDLANSPFHRFVSRSLLIAAVGGIVPLAHAFGISSWHETTTIPL
jgi:hypothetical protein